MRVLLVGEFLFYILGAVAILYAVSNFFRTRKFKRIIMTQQRQNMDLRDTVKKHEGTIAVLSREVEAQKVLNAGKHTPKDARSSEYRN